MKNALKYALGVVLPALLGGQALACYTVYDRANQVVYHAAAAPVDMRYQIHQTLPAVFPGGHLVFSVTDTACPPVNSSRRSGVNLAVNSLPRRSAYAPAPGVTVIQSPGGDIYTNNRP